MNDRINMKEIERKAYTAYHEDGLIDIVIGFFIMSFAMLIILDIPTLAGGWASMAVFGYMAFKKSVTVPRIGYVKLKQNRVFALAIGAFVIGFVVLGLVGFILIKQGIPAWMNIIFDNYMISIGLIGCGLFMFGGYAFRVKRMYGYALLTLALFFAGHFVYFPLQYYLLVLSIILIASGLTLLYQFVHKYPKATQAMGE
jgi:hypothetical protein